MQQSTTVSAVAGAVIFIGVWLADAVWNFKIPPEVSVAMTTIVMALLVHFVPDNPPAVPSSKSGV